MNENVEVRCTWCGHQQGQGNRFCASCGQNLAPEFDSQTRNEPHSKLSYWSPDGINRIPDNSEKLTPRSSGPPASILRAIGAAVGITILSLGSLIVFFIGFSLFTQRLFGDPDVATNISMLLGIGISIAAGIWMGFAVRPRWGAMAFLFLICVFPVFVYKQRRGLVHPRSGEPCRRFPALRTNLIVTSVGAVLILSSFALPDSKSETGKRGTTSGAVIAANAIQIDDEIINGWVNPTAHPSSGSSTVSADYSIAFAQVDGLTLYLSENPVSDVQRAQILAGFLAWKDWYTQSVGRSLTDFELMGSINILGIDIFKARDRDNTGYMVFMQYQPSDGDATEAAIWFYLADDDVLIPKNDAARLFTFYDCGKPHCAGLLIDQLE